MGDIHCIEGQAHWRLRLKAAGTSVLLSVLFVIAYGASNWFTAQRSGTEVQTWHFAWEATVIPYIPLLIVPYMSMDLLFFLATFLCRDERELRRFALRVVFSVLVATAFFLILPLKLDWPARPHAGGWFGDFVEQSCTAPFLMEYPHNLFPSLHIALCLIVANIYGRHTRGFVRILSWAWFSLIGVSTMLTWQHHLVDVAGGLILAGFAFYVYPEAGSRQPVTPNARIGSYYAAGAVALLMLAKEVGLWGAFLVWPASALGITAAAYFGLGPGIFRKTDGRLQVCTRLVLAPILIGHYLSFVYYRRQCPAWNEAVPGVLIGRALNDAEADDAVKQGVTAVLDLAAEFSAASPFLGIRHRSLPILDLTTPTPEQLQEAVTFIAEGAARGIVYIHCKAGYSRSAAVISAYLLATGQAATPEEAVELVRQARPSIVIRPEAMKAISSIDFPVTLTS